MHSAVFSIVVVACASLAKITDALSLPLPNGPFNVGSKAYLLPKITSPDPVAPNRTGTTILLNFYYPTHSQPVRAEYIWKGLASIYEKYYKIPYGSFRNATALVSYDAKALHAREHAKLRLPTLVFGPPFAGPPSQLFYSLFSDLVSYGYNVVTIDHPYEQPFLEFPDGTGIPGLAMDFNPPGDGLEYLNNLIEYRLSDTSAVLDALPTLSQNLAIPLNVSHVALFGHSLGGPVALGQILVERKRNSTTTILGAINIDGSVVGPAGTNDTSADLKIPSLLVAASGHNHESDPTFPDFLKQQSAWHKEVRILGNVNHTDFSDLVVLKQGAGIAGGEDAIRATRLVEIVRKFVGDFLTFVGTTGEEGVLSGSVSVKKAWPEVDFVYNGTGSVPS